MNGFFDFSLKSDLLLVFSLVFKLALFWWGNRRFTSPPSLPKYSCYCWKSELGHVTSDEHGPDCPTWLSNIFPIYFVHKHRKKSLLRNGSIQNAESHMQWNKPLLRHHFQMIILQQLVAKWPAMCCMPEASAELRLPVMGHCCSFRVGRSFGAREEWEKGCLSYVGL